MPRFCGLLNIHKPPGMTSRQVVDRVVRCVKPDKAGHAGTLDPLATGVLVVCAGSATRLISWVQQQRKIYRAGFRFGFVSDTDDITGKVTPVSASSQIDTAQLASALNEFIGRIQQVPPQYSAVHVNGQRAYKLARKGHQVDIQPRTVEIQRIDVLGSRDNECELEIECGSGTYIRSIGRDLGIRLGTGAIMTSLVRTRIGDFCLDDAVNVDDLQADTIGSLIQPPLAAVTNLPRLEVSDIHTVDLRHGRAIPVNPSAILPSTTTKPIAIVNPAGELVCLAEPDPAGLHWKPRMVFQPTEAS